MKTIKETRKILNWDFKGYGVFEATIWDGKMTDFRACKGGSLPTLHTDDPGFLRAIREAIDDTLKELGKS